MNTLWLCKYFLCSALPPSSTSGSGTRFIELDPVVSASHPAATFTFSERTSPFNLHLHTGTHAGGGLRGDFTIAHTLDKPVAVGNVVLQSAAPATPARVAMYEMYAAATSPRGKRLTV